MNRNSVNVTAQQVYHRKLFAKITKIVFLLLIIILAVVYLFLYIVFNTGKFTITLDKNMSDRKNIFLSLDGSLEGKTNELKADTIDYMDNISIDWIDPLVDDPSINGAHNGTNYIAYSFYIVNAGKAKVNYWYKIAIDDTIKNVDRAIRVMIYQNGNRIVYAKKNETTKKEEEGTKAFYSSDTAVLEERKNFAPNEKDRYTIVIYIEGDDPDCTNDLLGGEIKMHMDITEEHLSEEKNRGV